MGIVHSTLSGAAIVVGAATAGGVESPNTTGGSPTTNISRVDRHTEPDRLQFPRADLPQPHFIIASQAPPAAAQPRQNPPFLPQVIGELLTMSLTELTMGNPQRMLPFTRSVLTDLRATANAQGVPDEAKLLAYAQRQEAEFWKLAGREPIRDGQVAISGTRNAMTLTVSDAAGRQVFSTTDPLIIARSAAADVARGLITQLRRVPDGAERAKLVLERGVVFSLDSTIERVTRPQPR